MSTLSVMELEVHRNYQFTLDGTREEHFLVAGEQRDLEASLLRLRQVAHWSPWTIPAAGEGLHEDLRQHAGRLVPDGVAQKLYSHRGPLKLITEVVHLPWELVLSEHIVARQATMGVATPKGLPTEEPIALWAGLDHPRVFPWAKPLVEACQRGWSAGSGVDTGLGLLTDAKVGAAYLVAGLSPTGDLVLQGQILNLAAWVPRQAQKARKVCRFLFLQLVDHQAQRMYERADQVARAMLDLGVETVIVTYWQPDLERLAVALEKFFQGLEEGSVGQAFAGLRDSFPADDGRLSRWAFGLYGNADLEGRELRPVRVGSTQSATTIPRFGKADYRLKITAGPEAGREVPVFSHTLAAGQRLVLGKPGLKRCQIEVKDGELAPEAFAFEWTGVEAYLVNLSGSPEKVTVDGLPVSGKLHLQGTQTIRSGASEFVFSPVSVAPAPVALSTSPLPMGQPGSAGGTPSESGRYQLMVVSGVEEDLGRTYPLGEVSTVVGREGVFTLHDPAVSRQHLVVLERHGLHFVNHLEGGDLVLNGVPVAQESELRHGDRLVLSSTTSLLFSDRTRELPT